MWSTRVVVTGRSSFSRNMKRIPRPIRPNSKMPSLSSDPWQPGGHGIRTILRVPGNADGIPAQAFDLTMTALRFHPIREPDLHTRCPLILTASDPNSLLFGVSQFRGSLHACVAPCRGNYWDAIA